ncbi:hypothetical protein [Pseudomonas sp. CFBP 13719]|jgi:hypothetical protein|uniref:hypothetical protein n=1 Tax=Pseudomonas sp. CFBP 13719 TaxID=2775303 RepID=UPI0017812F0B|nr:hypothetical protein [Pseudomonas sp. CFBP 13719]MBD8682623.1 hypothetical protein [Pseudomonas sp. CFBP 13719]
MKHQDNNFFDRDFACQRAQTTRPRAIELRRGRFVVMQLLDGSVHEQRDQDDDRDRHTEEKQENRAHGSTP